MHSADDLNIHKDAEQSNTAIPQTQSKILEQVLFSTGVYRLFSDARFSRNYSPKHTQDQFYLVYINRKLSTEIRNPFRIMLSNIRMSNVDEIARELKRKDRENN